MEDELDYREDYSPLISPYIGIDHKLHCPLGLIGDCRLEVEGMMKIEEDICFTGVIIDICR